MKKKNLLSILICLTALLCCQHGWAASSALLCDCYETPQINAADFVKGDMGTISPLTTSCKESFVMTSVTQSPEKDPAFMGQYLIISSVKCCRVCLP